MSVMVHSFLAMIKKNSSLDYFKTLGENISEIRRESGITQEQLADKIGTGQSTLANYEAGTRRVSLATLAQIAKALNQPMEVFLPGEAQKRGPVSKLDRELAKVKLLPENQQQIVVDHIQSIIRNNQAKA